MENAATVIVITSSGEKEGNGSKEMKLEDGVAVKSKLDEYRKIADLTGFENLKAMVLAESLMKRKRTRKKEKKKDKTKLQSSYREIADLTGYDNLKAMLEAEASMRIERRNKKTQKRKTQSDAPENHIVNFLEEQVELDEDEGLNKIEEKKGNRRREKRRKRQRAKFDEYLKISDLSGFENLKPTVEAEASMREIKKNKKMVDMECCGREGVNGPELIQKSRMDEPQHHIIDPVKGDEDAGTVEDVPMLSAMRGGDGIDPVEVIGHCFSSLNSVEVIDRCFSSSGDDKSASGVNLGRSADHMGEAVQSTTKTGANDGENCVEVINIFLSCSDVSLDRKVEDALPMESTVKGKKRKKRRNKTRPTQEKDKANYAREENDAKYNAVLRMLLRKPRYFDASNWNLETCLICGKENHTAACCEVKKKNKPCFLCASYKHNWKNCIRGKDCFIGKGTHHIANDCSETDKANILGSVICLKCGDSGHHMF